MYKAFRKFFTILLAITKNTKSTSSISTNTTKTMSTPTPTIKIIPNKMLYVSEPNPRMFGNPGNEGEFNPEWTNKNWLKSKFHFNFAEYRNPLNPSFGVLKVMNDDVVQPHRGFGSHPHGDMEIITYIVNGELTHQDSHGNKESLGRGSIQFMSAGTGVIHSEFNHGDKPLRFIQTWINPSHRGLPSNYGSYNGNENENTNTNNNGRKNNKNQLQHLVSDIKNDDIQTPVKISQDVNVHATELDLGKKVMYKLPEGRQAYLVCLEGQIKVNGKILERQDACEITAAGGGAIELEATKVEDTENGGKVAHVLIFSMKEVPGSGRKDV